MSFSWHRNKLAHRNEVLNPPNVLNTGGTIRISGRSVKAVLEKRLRPDWGVALGCDHWAESETARGQKGNVTLLSRSAQPQSTRLLRQQPTPDAFESADFCAVGWTPRACLRQQECEARDGTWIASKCMGMGQHVIGRTLYKSWHTAAVITLGKWVTWRNGSPPFHFQKSQPTEH